MRKYNLTKKLFILLLIIICLIITGCSSGYTITLNFEDGSLYKTINLKDGEVLNVEEPTKEGHTFEGWYLDNNKITNDNTFTQDTTLIAKFTINQYTYKFIVDGEVIKEETANYGAEIDFPLDPTKDGTKENKYVFDKWDNEATTLLKDEVFNAIFTEEKKTYEYVFMNDDGTIIKEEIAEYGSTIVYPDTPSKQDTQEFSYTFTGWDNDETVLTDDIVFVAKYSSVKKQYTYKFVNDDGTVLKEDVVDYGTMPIEPENTPVKEETTDKKYIFIGWDKTISNVTDNIIYTATYSEVSVINTLDNKVVSILGDSISTFYAEGSEMNSYYGGNNEFFYPRYSTTIKTVDKTWWYQLIKNNNLVLGINNSWSGSCAMGTGSSAGVSDNRINTIDDNGTPDIVIIYLGTNDSCSGYDVNKYKAALETMITKIRKICSPQIFITTLGYTNYKGNNFSNDLRLDYNNVIRETANKYNCGIVPLDEYIVDDSYMYYLEDTLHYNAKGATLLSLIYEKAIKEYNDIEFTKEIQVQHKEKLPEGVIAQITATASTGFWTGYQNNVYLAPSSSSEKPTYSTRIEIKLNTEDNKYYVSNIYKSGDTGAYNSDFVLLISDSHVEKKLLVDGLSEVKVGSLVEFDTTLSFPVVINFKEGEVDNSGNDGGIDLPDDNLEEDGKLIVGAYNDGVWTKYDKNVIVYESDKIDQKSTFINFYIIKLTKEADSNKYSVTGLKPVDQAATFEGCDYYVLIYRDLEVKTFYENCNLGDKVTIEGDITSGNGKLVFE